MPSHQLVPQRERERVRDLLRYYKPKLETRPSRETTPTILATCEPQSDLPDTPKSFAVEVVDVVDSDGPDDSRFLAHDPTLTAFAQLAAFRLNCQRSFISLMDHENQYILAEATRSVSLDTPGHAAQGDELYLGPRALDMVWGICPNTIEVFTATDGSKNFSAPNILATNKYYIMNDLSAIEKYKSRPYVAGWPYMRFYAEVPIHSPTGHVIGTFCVVDNKPREGLDNDGLAALNEISGAIMKHLELVQMQHGLQRASRMVAGLGMFADGKDDAKGWWTSDIESAMEISSITNGSDTRRTGTVRTLSSPTASPGLSSGDQSSGVKTPQLIDQMRVDQETTQTPETQVDTLPTENSVLPLSVSVPEKTIVLADEVSLQESLASFGIKKLFTRASVLIREALDLEGVLFIDACLRDIAATPDPEIMRFDTLKSSGFTRMPDVDLTSLGDIPNPRLSEYLYPPLNTFLQRSASDNDYKSQNGILGFSLSRHSEDYPYRPSLSQSILRELLCKYRYGHVFIFNEDGTINENQEDSTNVKFADHEKSRTLKLENAKEDSLEQILLSICPDARALIFFPLWDPQRDQWFAGSLAWTTDTTRILEAMDVNFLAAFGSCIMSENSRLNALTSDRAKADFISSVSHELRSPLHGILANAEELQNTSTGLEQDEMIRTVAMCGELLLETVDQILDYSKANKLNKNPSLKFSGHGDRLWHLPANVESTDLSSLVEDVVGSCFVNNQYRNSVLAPQSGSKIEIIGVTSLATEAVMVVTSISWRESWIFKTESDSWKRILTNLLGNALKHTTSGFVHVSIEAEAAQSLDPNQTTIVLQVEDSGKGISKDFLKYELYTPFAKEHGSLPGTGLGLSIVREIATGLGGSVDVKSKIAHGTTVRVTAPCEAVPGPSKIEYNSLVYEVRARAMGLTLCLVSFNISPDLMQPLNGLPTSHQRRIAALESSISNLAVDWFGMKTSTANTISDAKGNMVIALQSQVRLSEVFTSECSLILIPDGGKNILLESRLGVFYLTQPFGPQKFAKLLKDCLECTAVNARAPVPNVSPLAQHILTLKPFRKSKELIGQVALKDSRIEISKFHTSTDVPGQLSSQQLSGQPQCNRIRDIIETIQPTALDHAKQKKSTVLLVEDNIINMKVLTNFLKRSKQDYITAENGLEALHKYHADHSTIKLIFMDISMPIMDGLTSTRQIRLFEKENSLPRTRIVILTCFSTEVHRKDAIISGADMFLVKPVSMKNLQPILVLPPILGLPNNGELGEPGELREN